MCNIVIPIGNTNYEFYDVPNKIAISIVALLQEYTNEDTNIMSAESERQGE